MLYLALHALLWSDAFAPLQSPILPRGAAVKVDPLVSDTVGGPWGPPDRTADHATVAINSRGDVAIASHTSRTDIAGHPALKQVEVAIFTYDTVMDQWTLAQQELVGSIHYNPRGSTEQTKVKCERPDVIAVGERFFVVWTRRYDGSLPNQFEEPAVLECSWLQWNGVDYDVLNDSSTFAYPDGWGYPLDSNYHVRECAGVPDAVLLDPGDATHDPTVGVVFPHQTDFGDDPQSVPPFDGTRRFDLRLATCSLTAAGTLIGGAAATPIVAGLVFDGPTAAMGESAGLILPDLAPMPIPPDPPVGPRVYRFWLAHEEQFYAAGMPVPDGRIRLRVCEGSVGGAWAPLSTHSFGSAANPTVRRRANVASYLGDSPFITTASISFSKTQTGSGDVVYEEWNWSEATGLNKVVWPGGVEWVSDVALHENRPVPLHGRTVPLRRRCTMERALVPFRIDAFDVATNGMSLKASSYDGVGRPAVAYRYAAGADRDDFVVTWEQFEENSTTTQRIWLRVE